MRKVFSVAMMAAMVCLVGMSRDASATATVTLIWGACGGGAGGCVGVGTSTLSVAAGGGQTVRLDVLMSHDETSGIDAHAFSLNFDTDLGNELDFTGMAAIEWTGTDADPSGASQVYGPFTSGTQGTVESTGAVAGRVNSVESGSVTANNLPRNGVAYSVGTFTATAPATYRVAQVFFIVTANGGIDGADVFSGMFNGLADVTSNGNAQVVAFNYGDATLNMPPIPEPGTVSLLGLGLLGLVLAGRRGRRS